MPLSEFLRTLDAIRFEDTANDATLDELKAMAVALYPKVRKMAQLMEQAGMIAD